MGSFVWFSCLCLELWSLNCQKLCVFLQTFADVSKKSKAAIAIYVYASECSRFTLLENGIGYYAMTCSSISRELWLRPL